MWNSRREEVDFFNNQAEFNATTQQLNNPVSALLRLSILFTSVYVLEIPQSSCQTTVTEVKREGEWQHGTSSLKIPPY
jgi:hypothetical protein